MAHVSRMGDEGASKGETTANAGLVSGHKRGTLEGQDTFSRHLATSCRSLASHTHKHRSTKTAKQNSMSLKYHQYNGVKILLKEQ